MTQLRIEVPDVNAAEATKPAVSQSTVVRSSDAANEDNTDLATFLRLIEKKMPEIGQEDPETGGRILDRWVTQSREEGSNIKYGKDIEISSADFKNLGQDIDIVTYGLDKNGNLVTHDLMDFNEDGVQHFMSKVDPKDGVVDLNQDFKLKMQRVEVNGETVGFFIHGADSKHGTYMDASALQHFNLSPEKMAQLQQAEPIQAAQPEAPSPAGPAVTTDTAVALGMGARLR